MINEKAYAKINLTLNIVGKRSDGYHELDTVMQTISLCDDVQIEKYDTIVSVCEGVESEKNITTKAAKAFFEYTGISGGVKVAVTKRIPVCGGFGGGSADGAAVLRGLNSLYQTKLSSDELRKIAFNVGADVPFLIDGGTCLCKGIGEKITPVKRNLPLYLCISAGKSGASTKAMFEKIDSFGLKVCGSESMILALKDGNLKEIARNVKNDFELPCRELCGDVEEIEKIMVTNGALVSSLTGSGSGVFGIFESKVEALNAEKALKENWFACFAEAL